MRNIVTALVLTLTLALCAGLIVPGCVKVREASNRMQCVNQLRQIGLSLHSYEDSYRRFPSAAQPSPDLNYEERLSWLISISPFIEATNLYVRMDREKGWEAGHNRYLALTVHRLFQCPSFPDRLPESTLVPTHFVGLAGLGPDAVSLPTGIPEAGFFGYERMLTLSAINDHSSTLLAALETSRASGAWTAAGLPTVRGLIDDGSPYLGMAGQFGGLHPKGANALFADGSVRLLHESIDRKVIQAMATIQGSKEAMPADVE